MLIDNQQIDVSLLPKVEEVRYELLEKNYLWATLISRILTALFIWFPGFIVITATNTWGDSRIVFGFLIFWALFSLYLIIMGWLGFRKKSYALRDKDIIYKSGVIWKRKITIPFNRIQHSNIRQGPIDQLFELASLNIFTAGGSSSDLTIPGLLPETAQSLKEFILQKTERDEEE
jgi:membrane protein YdbS with pleckstrin-like domain